MSKAGMIRAALRKAVGSAGMLSRGDLARARRATRVTEAATALARSNDGPGARDASSKLSRRVRAQVYLEKRASRTDNANPMSALKKPKVGSRRDMAESNRRLDANTKRYDDAYAMLEQQGLPDDVIRRRLKSMGIE